MFVYVSKTEKKSTYDTVYNTDERERKGACSSSDFRQFLWRKFVVCISKCFQLHPLTRGFALGPHWGIRPQTPIIGLRSRARHEPRSFFVRTGSLHITQLCTWNMIRYT